MSAVWSHRNSLVALAVLAAASICNYALPAMADDGRRLRDHPPVWNDLAPQERGVLKHHSERWHNYPPSLRQRLRGQAKRVIEMEPEQLERLRRRALEFRQMPRQQQQSLCTRFEHERGYRPAPCLPRK